MKKAGKIIIGLMVVGALGALVYTRMNKKEAPIEEVPDPSVQVQYPEKGTIEISTSLTGTVEPADVVYVIPKVAGEVLEVYTKMGETLEPGQPLFKIDNKQLDAAKITLDTTKVSLDDAQKTLNRMQVLYDSGDISAQAYEQTVNGVKMARLQYESAKLNYDTQLENTTVTAPIGGLLEKFDVEVHDMVSSGNYVAVISGEGSRSVSFNVTERIVGGLAVGNPLTIEKNGMEYKGMITEVSTMVDPATGLFKVKASLENAESLASGTIVKLYVTSQKAENVMTIPVDCVNYSTGNAFVYTYDAAENKARKMPIEEGLIDSHIVEVKSGLSYEDQVIVTWTKEIYDGAPVQLAGEDSDSSKTAETAATTTAETAAKQ